MPLAAYQVGRFKFERPEIEMIKKRLKEVQGYLYKNTR